MFRQRYDAASTNGTVLELNRRTGRCSHLLLTNVSGKISKLILNLPEVIMNALIVTLSVIFKPMQILENTIGVICDDDA
jgi:hypothetical protein